MTNTSCIFHCFDGFIKSSSHKANWTRIKCLSPNKTSLLLAWVSCLFFFFFHPVCHSQGKFWKKFFEKKVWKFRKIFVFLFFASDLLLFELQVKIVVFWGRECFVVALVFSCVYRVCLSCPSTKYTRNLLIFGFRKVIEHKNKCFESMKSKVSDWYQ